MQKFWHPDWRKMESLWLQLQSYTCRRKKPEIVHIVFSRKEFVMMLMIGIESHLQDWRLFVDISWRSLKFVFIHSGNMYLSIHIGHSVHLVKKYKNVNILLEILHYKKTWITGLGWFQNDCFVLKVFRVVTP